ECESFCVNEEIFRRCHCYHPRYLSAIVTPQPKVICATNDSTYVGRNGATARNSTDRSPQVRNWSDSRFYQATCRRNKSLPPVVGTQTRCCSRAVWLDHSGEMSTNTQTSKASDEIDGDLNTVPIVGCRLCKCYGKGETGRIPNNNESPSASSSNQATDREKLLGPRCPSGKVLGSEQSWFDTWFH
ncbi:hypothetical protein AVEN_165471-1, partial [Araneus ventricosus]